jgi:hypothetical protein
MDEHNSKELMKQIVQPAVLEPSVPLSTTDELSTLFYGLFPDATPRGMRDNSYFDALLRDFSTEFDIDEEMKRFHAWTLDQPQGPIVSPRSRFRDWMLRTRTYRFRPR